MTMERAWKKLKPNVWGFAEQPATIINHFRKFVKKQNRTGETEQHNHFCDELTMDVPNSHTFRFWHRHHHGRWESGGNVVWYPNSKQAFFLGLRHDLPCVVQPLLYYILYHTGLQKLRIDEDTPTISSWPFRLFQRQLEGVCRVRFGSVNTKWKVGSTHPPPLCTVEKTAAGSLSPKQQHAAHVRLDIKVTKETTYTFRFLIERVPYESDTNFPPPTLLLLAGKEVKDDQPNPIVQPNPIGTPKKSCTDECWFPVVYSSFLRTIRTYAVYEERVLVDEASSGGEVVVEGKPKKQ